MISAVLCFVFGCAPLDANTVTTWQNRIPAVMRTAPMEGRQMVVLVKVEHGD